MLQLQLRVMDLLNTCALRALELTQLQSVLGKPFCPLSLRPEISAATLIRNMS